MTAYRHDEYGTGRSHTGRVYAFIMLVAGLFGTGLAVLTWS